MVLVKISCFVQASNFDQIFYFYFFVVKKMLAFSLRLKVLPLALAFALLLVFMCQQDVDNSEFVLGKHSIFVKAELPYITNQGKTCDLDYPKVACGNELICDPKSRKCVNCMNSTQCWVGASENQCKLVTYSKNNKIQQSNICVHKDLVPNVSLYDVLAVVVRCF